MSKKDSTNIDEKNKKKVDKAGFQKLTGIFQFMMPYKLKLIAGLVFLVLSSSLLLAVPQILGMMIDVAGLDASALPNGAFKMDFMKPLQEAIGGSELSGITMLLIGVLFIQAIFSFFRVYLFALVHVPAMADVRQTLYKKYTNLPLSFYDQNRTGDLISRITADVSTLQDAFSVGIAELLRQLIILIVGTITLFIITPPLTVFMLLTIPVIVLSAMVFGRYIRKLSKKTQDSLAKTNVIVEETLQNINMVKAFANEFFELLRYKDAMKETVQVAIHRSLYRGAFVAFIVFALFSGIALVMWYGTNLVVEGELSIGELVSFVIYTMFIGGSITGLANLYGTLQQAIGSSERIMEILDTPNEPEASAPIEVKERLQGNISLEGVIFSYPTREDVTVLEGLSMNISSGEQIALVGHSGAGKSTIVQLLLRFYQASQGKISVDGLDIRNYDLSQYRSQIAIVPQEVLLFGGSIRENIAYGKTDATNEEIVEAARKANALEFIESFPEGLDTVVGERGIKLSGGQRQRIAIARAILKDPAILLLDEATSSLDAASEQLVQEALETLMQGRTSIVIAHRLATIRKVNRIYVLDKGHIVEAGSHEELMAKDEGLYSNLVKLQFDVKHA